MAGPNLTGKPKTTDYNLGRGILYFALIDATTGLPKAFRDLGNATEFNLSTETETLEHQSSRQGLKVTDREVPVSQKVNLSLTLDELNFENLALFLAGEVAGSDAADSAGHLNPTVAGVTERELIAPGDVELGRWYELRDGSGNRCYDIDVANLTIKDEGATTYSITTDYLVNAEMGMVFFEVGGSVANGPADGVDFILVADGSADQYIPEVKALTTSSIAGALKFVSENPADSDRKSEVQFHQVSLKAEGDLGLISDEFTVMTLTGIAESNALADPDSPICTIRHVVSPQS